VLGEGRSPQGVQSDKQPKSRSRRFRVHRGDRMKRLRMYAIPLSAMAVLGFAAVAVAQSTPEGIDASGNTTGVQNSTSIPGNAPAESTTPDEGKAPAQSEQSIPDDTTVTVAIKDGTFDPEQLEVAAGTTVTWTNGDTEAHTVTADNGLFDSGVIEPGRYYSTWFGGSGTVEYHSKTDPDVKGSVVVGGASGGGETTTRDPASSTPPPGQTGTSTSDPESNPPEPQEQVAEEINQLPIYTPPA
jgi:plastocyanin